MLLAGSIPQSHWDKSHYCDVTWKHKKTDDHRIVMHTWEIKPSQVSNYCPSSNVICCITVEKAGNKFDP